MRPLYILALIACPCSAFAQGAIAGTVKYGSGVGSGTYLISFTLTVIAELPVVDAHSLTRERASAMSRLFKVTAEVGF